MPKKRTTPPARYSDMGTPELRQHHSIITEDADEHSVRARNITQAPLDWYLAHDHITEPQWKAGDRIYRSFVYAGIPHATITDFTQVARSNKPHSFTDKQIAARERLYGALDQLESEGQHLVIRVCCFGEWPHAQGLPKRYAVQRLRSALDELAIYFGFINRGAKK